MSASKIVQEEIEIAASLNAVFEVLITADYYRQWDDLPDGFTDEELDLGTVLNYEPHARLRVTEMIPGRKLRMTLELPQEPLGDDEYDVSYLYELTPVGGGDKRTKLTITIGDFAPLKKADDYLSESVKFARKAAAKIKGLAESLDPRTAGVLGE